MWKNQTYYYLPVIFGCLAYIGKYLFLKQIGPIIEIASGKIQGVIEYSREGREFISYLGIRYAQKPVGDLRFQSPQAPSNWTDVFLADQYGTPCLGVEFLTSGRISGEEDCLTLNVFQSVTTKKNLPVMVFIHGGGFMTGSSAGYGPHYLMDSGDVVMVSMNYRLGIFGFLNVENEPDARGNMGLKDQTMALRWVQENIAAFNGDPTRVTLFGESAGGASVHLHMLSPLSRGLFHRAISMSGNALNPFWQMHRNYTEQVEYLKEKFNCHTETDYLFVECLKKIDAYDLASIHVAVQSPIHPLRDAFSPSIESIKDEEAFLMEHPYELMRTGNFYKVPWLQGANEMEGLVFVARVMYNETLAETITTEETWKKYMPIILFYDENDEEASSQIKNYYLGDRTDWDINNSTQHLANLFSDRLFFQSMHLTASIHLQHAPLFLYHYTYNAALNVWNILKSTSPYSRMPIELNVLASMIKEWFVELIYGSSKSSLGPCHGSEMPLLFTINPILDIGKSIPDDYEMSKALVQTWTDFAKDIHSLKFRDIRWPPLKPGESLKYMKLDQTGGFLVDPFSSRLELWEKLNIL